MFMNRDASPAPTMDMYSLALQQAAAGGSPNMPMYPMHGMHGAPDVGYDPSMQPPTTTRCDCHECQKYLAQQMMMTATAMGQRDISMPSASHSSFGDHMGTQSMSQSRSMSPWQYPSMPPTAATHLDGNCTCQMCQYQMQIVAQNQVTSLSAAFLASQMASQMSPTLASGSMRGASPNMNGAHTHMRKVASTASNAGSMRGTSPVSTNGAPMLSLKRTASFTESDMNSQRGSPLTPSTPGDFGFRPITPLASDDGKRLGKDKKGSFTLPPVTQADLLKVQDLRGQLLEFCSNHQNAVFVQSILHKLKTLGDMAQLNSIFDELCPHIVHMARDTNLAYVAMALLQTMEKDKILYAMDILFRNPEDVKELCTSTLHSRRAVYFFLDSLAPAQLLPFVELMAGSAFTVAQTQQGCICMQRVLEVVEAHDAQRIIDALVPHMLELASHEYGNYIVQYIVENHLLGDRQEEAISPFQGHVLPLSLDKFGSTVMEKIIEYANPMRAQTLCEEIFLADDMAMLMDNRYANYIIQTAIVHCSTEALPVIAAKLEPHMKTTQYGRRISKLLQMRLTGQKIKRRGPQKLPKGGPGNTIQTTHASIEDVRQMENTSRSSNRGFSQRTSPIIPMMSSMGPANGMMPMPDMLGGFDASGMPTPTSPSMMEQMMRMAVESFQWNPMTAEATMMG